MRISFLVSTSLLFVSNTAFSITGVCHLGEKEKFEVYIDENFRRAIVKDINQKDEGGSMILPCNIQENGLPLCNKLINIGRIGFLLYNAGLEPSGEIFFSSEFYRSGIKNTTKYECVRIID